jgi:hypothetical protein
MVSDKRAARLPKGVDENDLPASLEGVSDWTPAILSAIRSGWFGLRPKRTLSLQDKYVSAWSKSGTSRQAHQTSGINRVTTYKWNLNDTYGFTARLSDGKQELSDELEEIALDLVRQLKPTNSPLLLLALLNANLPEKYRTNIVGTDDTAKDTLKELRAIRKQQENSAGESTLSGTDSEELGSASAEAEGAEGSTPSISKDTATEVAVAAEKWLRGQRSS